MSRVRGIPAKHQDFHAQIHMPGERVRDSHVRARFPLAALRSSP
jgi:hypothetical protein